jgi:hypothetical protein
MKSKKQGIMYLDFAHPRHHHYNHAPITLGDNLVLPHVYNSYKFKAPFLVGPNYHLFEDKKSGLMVHEKL